jgi:alpha-galactosidase
MRVLIIVSFNAATVALDNGYRLPPMGWSSWYGFTQNINEGMLRGMADGMVSSGLHAAGYQHIWLDDGWALPRDNVTRKPRVDEKLFPSGMRNLSDYMHSRGLKFGIYTSKGPLTCLGYQPTQPQRPGSCGFEQIDADTYAHDWRVDQVKEIQWPGMLHEGSVVIPPETDGAL